MQQGATWCKMVQDGARWCKVVRDGARWCKMVQDSATPCNTMQYHAIPFNKMQLPAILCNTMQYHAVPCYTVQNNAIPCNTMQYHGTLITADGAYHCPVGSIMAILLLLLGECNSQAKCGTWCYVDDDAPCLDANPSLNGEPHRWTCEACNSSARLGLLGFAFIGLSFAWS